MNISPEEASQALQEIESSRAAMRRAIQTHRGHLHLWLWGCIWMAVSVLNWILDQRALHTMLWIMAAGIVGSVLIGTFQGRQIRGRFDRRFLAVVATLLVFGYFIWPFILGDLHSYDFRSYKGAFAYFTLVWMQLYIVAGIWFDNYWFWIGVGVTVLVVASLLFAPAAFWAVTLIFGLVMLGTGFVVRNNWK